MLLHSLKLNNLLSYGPDTEVIDLRPLNVIIGPNGSGKSNLLEGIALLQATPGELVLPIREGGGIQNWLWKGNGKKTPVATLEAVVENPYHSIAPLHYRLAFTEANHRLQITDERIENEKPDSAHTQPAVYYGYERNLPVLTLFGDQREQKRYLKREDIDPERSILAQRKDPEQYPEITYLGETFAKIRLYREWSFGRYTPSRLAQKPDLPNDFLEEDGRNLGLVLNRLRREPDVRAKLVEALQLLYADIDDFDVHIEGGTVQVFLYEGRFSIPATRLSDGTLRYLCLLAILCHPTPPPLVCIEEPELGLHPDILPTIAELLLEASQRGQLIVTTHSSILIDALTPTPEAVLVCEKHAGSTTMRRLDEASLALWLQKYSLGQLWRQGELGGNRW
ncbi:MAG: AAA family ATPase [Caldilineaceae bacterium]